MKQIPLHLVVSRLKRLPLPRRIETLRVMVQAEKPFSVRRNELQSLLNGALIRQLKHELRRTAA